MNSSEHFLIEKAGNHTTRTRADALEAIRALKRILDYLELKGGEL